MNKGSAKTWMNLDQKDLRRIEGHRFLMTLERLWGRPLTSFIFNASDNQYKHKGW